MTKSAMAAHVNRFSIFSHGVKRSLREMAAKSWVRGAPAKAAPDARAGIPGMISRGSPLLLLEDSDLSLALISFISRFLQISKTRPAMA